MDRDKAIEMLLTYYEAGLLTITGAFFDIEDIKLCKEALNYLRKYIKEKTYVDC